MINNSIIHDNSGYTMYPKYVNTSIVFQEIPDEVTLAINLSECPNNCPNCHSSYLQQSIGDELTPEMLNSLLAPYVQLITCVCFMGGDARPQEVARLGFFLKKHYGGSLKSAWYSGKADFPEPFHSDAFDYVKIGPYIEALGPLNRSTTNQRLYRIYSTGEKEDITQKFWRHIS